MSPRRPSARGQIHHGSSNSLASLYPFGRTIPGQGTVPVIVGQLPQKSAGLVNFATPTQRTYADDTHAPLLQPALHGATHDKLTSGKPLCNGMWFFATRFFVCLSLASNGSNVLECPMLAVLFRFRTPNRHNRIPRSTLIVATAGRSFVELAIKRRTADLQAARDFRHLSAVMRDRKPNDLVLHLFQRPHLTGAGQHG